jgi:RHS repeat-associated protein
METLINPNCKEKDFESGLYDFGFRKYSEETGRFLSVDPLWAKYPGWNPYHYCMNNPVMAKDPEGLAAWEVTRDWNKDDVKGYQNWYANHAKDFVGEKAECAKLQFMMRAQYAQENGLPLVFKTSSGRTIDAQSDDYNDMKDFVNKGIGKLSSNDMRANTDEIPQEEKQLGDMVKLSLTNTENGRNTKHVVGLVDVSDDKNLIIINGNYDGHSAGPVKINPNGSWILKSVVRMTTTNQKYQNTRDHIDKNSVLRFKMQE